MEKKTISAIGQDKKLSKKEMKKVLGGDSGQIGAAKGPVGSTPCDTHGITISIPYVGK